MALNHETEPTAGLGESPRRLDDRYELLERIGAGGMAEVWRARDLRLDRVVAVKVLPAGALRDESRRRKLEREARALAATSHPNIVSIYDYGEAATPDGDVAPYLVMELVDGSDLHRHLADRGPLPGPEARGLIAGILGAVGHAHSAGVVHGDLKPANIFIGSHGPKVGDFGVARILDEETGTTTVAATPTYAAPEILRGERATTASDVYSAACVAFELLAGQPPFEGSNGWDVAKKHLESPPPKLRRIRSDVPDDLDAAIGRALDKNPKRRFADATAFAAALDHASPVPATQPASATQTVPVPAASAGPREETVALGKPRPDPSRVALFGPFAGWWGRITSASPKGRVLLAVLIPLLLLFAFLAMRDPGPAMADVPDVVGDKYQEAASELRLAGFKVDVAFRPIAEGEPGRVIDTIPGPKDEVAAGSDVHLIVGALASTPAPTVFEQREVDDDGPAEREGGGKGKRRKNRDDD